MSGLRPKGAVRYGRLWLPGPFTPFEAEHVAATEQVCGGRLPEDYLRFMRTANGSGLPYSVRLPFETDREGSTGEVVQFGDLFALSPDETGAFDWGTVLGEHRHLESAYYRQALGEQFAPIARDGGGSLLLLMLNEARYGQVWAFVHGLPGWAGGRDGVPSEDCLGLLAHSFSHYLDLLFDESELA